MLDLVLWVGAELGDEEFIEENELNLDVDEKGAFRQGVFELDLIVDDEKRITVSTSSINEFLVRRTVGALVVSAALAFETSRVAGEAEAVGKVVVTFAAGTMVDLCAGGTLKQAVYAGIVLLVFE